MTDAPTVAVFFYGLFMDAQLLAAKGVTASGSERARLEGYRLVLGKRATLVPAAGHSAHGVLMHLSAVDVDRLYSDPSVSAYRAEHVRVVLESGEATAAVCYNLPPAVGHEPPNRDYARKLYDLGVQLGLPQSYLAEIKQIADHPS